MACSQLNSLSSLTNFSFQYSCFPISALVHELLVLSIGYFELIDIIVGQVCINHPGKIDKLPS